MIVIRFGKWDRCFFGKYVYRRLRIGKLWTPLAVRKPIATRGKTAENVLSEPQLIGFHAYLRGAQKFQYRALGTARRNKTRSDKTKASNHPSRK